MKDKIYRAVAHMYRKATDKICEQAFLRKIKNDSSNPAFIIGSPVYGNYGDSAILLAQMAFLRETLSLQRRILEVSYPEYYRFRTSLKAVVDPRAPIFCVGGGNMGNQWEWEELLRYNVLDDYPNNPITVFPQTIYYSDSGNPDYTPERAKRVYNGRKGLTLTARESRSYDLMRELFPETELLLIPDIVLWSDMEHFGVCPGLRKGALFCHRSDSEAAVSPALWLHLEQKLVALGYEVRHTEMDSKVGISKGKRARLVRSKMQEYCSAELVITDRLHGMVFSALTGTPCIVFGNYNYKICGTYEWIKYLPYIRYAESTEDAEQYIPELLAMKDCHYDNTPLTPYFEQLKEVVRKTCQGSV